MQVALGQDLHLGSVLVQAAFGCCIPLLYLCPDSLDTVQLELVVFILPSTSANSLLACIVVIAHCNLQIRKEGFEPVTFCL